MTYIRWSLLTSSIVVVLPPSAPLQILAMPHPHQGHHRPAKANSSRMPAYTNPACPQEELSLLRYPSCINGKLWHKDQQTEFVLKDLSTNG